MKTLLALILLCSVIFANPNISLVSRNNEHLIVVEAAVQNPQISYTARDRNLLITIQSPSIRGMDETSSVQNHNNSVLSTMATRVVGDRIEILLRDFRLPAGNIQTRERPDAILFHLAQNPPNNNNARQNAAEIAEVAEDFPLSLIVSGSVANLRSQPSTSAEITGRVLQDARITATDKSGEWYAVNTQMGGAAWIHQSVVRRSGGAVVPVIAVVAPIPAVGGNAQHIVPAESTIAAPQNISISDIAAAAADIEEEEAVVQDTASEEDQRTSFSYRRRGRDPFLPLDRSSFIREGLPNINNISLVGVLFDSRNSVALFEERRNNEITAFSMRVGDPVVSGKLLRIEANKVIFLLREATFSYTIEMELNN